MHRPHAIYVLFFLLWMFTWPPEGHVLRRFRPFRDEVSCILSVQRTFLHLAPDSSGEELTASHSSPRTHPARRQSAPPRLAAPAPERDSPPRPATGAGSAETGHSSAAARLRLHELIPRTTQPQPSAPEAERMAVWALHEAGKCEPCRFHYGAPWTSAQLLCFLCP